MSTRTDALVSQQETGKITAFIIPIAAGCHSARVIKHLGLILVPIRRGQPWSGVLDSVLKCGQIQCHSRRLHSGPTSAAPNHELSTADHRQTSRSHRAAGMSSPGLVRAAIQGRAQKARIEHDKLRRFRFLRLALSGVAA
jgi:hypothetical protein